MEVLEFRRCYKEMCDHYCGNGCRGCEAIDIDCELNTNEIEKLVEIVERWAKTHPDEAKKTEDAREPEKPADGCLFLTPKDINAIVVRNGNEIINLNHSISGVRCAIDELDRRISELFRRVDNASALNPKNDETCGIKPEDFVNHFIAEMLTRHEEQIEKLTQNVEKLMQPVNAVKPKRTHKDVLLAAFPDACISTDGIPDACPLSLDKHYDCNKFPNCLRCKRAHWLAKVEE